ncbi:DUF1062 domain-containing protein [Chryseobacterium sp. JK1]|uniref:DUF1062 domain-containing protein n=1 Tax=Chryseobacterium sp. JK1 TaxID=874294 RepID=UPI003D6989D9
MSIEYIWEIKAKNTPFLKKKCNHCSSDRFQCSDKFRLNTQKKNMDIWLIYRCVHCQNRYNMTLFSRIRTEKIDKDLFNKMSENDTMTAWEYAFSHEIRRKNNVEADLETVDYEVICDGISVEDLPDSDHEMLTIVIKSPFDFHLKISSVVRIGLKLSSGKLNRLIEMNGIFVHKKPLQRKHKIKNADEIRIHAVTLKKILSEE